MSETLGRTDETDGTLVNVDQTGRYNGAGGLPTEFGPFTAYAAAFGVNRDYRPDGDNAGGEPSPLPPSALDIPEIVYHL